MPQRSTLLAPIDRQSYLDTLSEEGVLTENAAYACILSDTIPDDLRATLKSKHFSVTVLVIGPHSDPEVHQGAGINPTSSDFTILTGALEPNPAVLRMAVDSLTATGVLVCAHPLAPHIRELHPELKLRGILTEDEWKVYLYLLDPADFKPAYDKIEHYYIFSRA